MNVTGIGRDSDRFFRAMLRLSNSPILITDARAPDNPIVLVNPAFERVTGYRAEEAIGRNCRFLQNDDRRQEGRLVIAGAIRTGTPCEALLRNYRKDGGMFWNRIYLFPVTDDEGAITHFVGIQHDVTTETELVLLVGRDASARQAAQREALRANATVAAVLDSITEGCFTLDREWHFLYMNAKAAEWMNRESEDLIGKNMWEEFPEAVGGIFDVTYRRVLRTGEYGQCEAYYPPLGRWIETRVYPAEAGLTVFFMDISRRKKYELALVHAATHDALTGLPNRKACLDTLTRRLGAEPPGGPDVAVIFIDLDHFKEINDAFGHAAGDEVLALIGQRLLGLASDSCYPARLSGDEFVIVADVGEEAARSLAMQVLDNIATPIPLKGRQVTLGASIGIALARGAMTADDLINQADTAMYLSKSNGRHSLTVFNGDVDNWNLMRHRLRQDMLQALQDGEFLLHYQPQLSLRENRVTGAEALIRWQHPEFGLLTPAAFLEIAEESPLIIEMGAWVFNEACRQLRVWHDLGHILKMSINVSARQLASRDLPDMMAQAIRRHGVSAHCVKLEVTESMLAQDFDATSQVLEGLKNQGFRIALDDFGTGYSNLAYISRLPVTAIKIDRSFVTGLMTDKAALPLIKGIVALAKSLDLTVICEGIETLEQRALLESTQCDSIQGYLISKPLPADAFYAGFLEERPA